MQIQFEVIFAFVWVRLGPFEAMFASVWVGFRFVFRPLGLCKCRCKCTCNRESKCNCYLIRATGGLSRRTNQMDWQIDNVWSCPAVISDGLRWFPRGPVMQNHSAKHITFAHGAVQNRIRPCKCKFQCKRKCKFECKRNLKWFLLPFCKNMLPARAGSTFLKTNFEQSAFKNPLFGALKASNEDSLGHLFGTYGS